MKPVSGSWLPRSNATFPPCTISVKFTRTARASRRIPIEAYKWLTLALEYSQQSNADYRATAAVRRSGIAATPEPE